MPDKIVVFEDVTLTASTVNRQRPHGIVTAGRTADDEVLLIFEEAKGCVGHVPDKPIDECDTSAPSNLEYLKTRVIYT